MHSAKQTAGEQLNGCFCLKPVFKAEGNQMKKIRTKHIVIAFSFLILFVISLFAGFFKWIFFIPATVFLAGYFITDRIFLRCPYCSHFINLERLFYARKHVYYCAHCGEIIKVEK